MHFHTIDNTNQDRELDLLDGYFKTRHALFSDWPAPNSVAGYEADVFDTPIFKPIWALVTHNSQVVAVGRMIAADGPATMLESVWPDAIKETLPEPSKTYELHRIGVLRDLDPAVSITARLKLLVGIAEYAFKTGRPHMFCLTAQRLHESTLQDWERLGPVVQVDGKPFVAIMAEAEQEGLADATAMLVQLEDQLPHDEIAEELSA